MKPAEGRDNIVELETGCYEVLKETNLETRESRTFLIEYEDYNELVAAMNVRDNEMDDYEYTVLFSRTGGKQ